MTLLRPHEETMRDYITMLKRDLSEHIETKIIVRMFDRPGETRADAWKAVRTSSPTRKRVKRLRKAEAHLEHYLEVLASKKEMEEVRESDRSDRPEQTD